MYRKYIKRILDVFLSVLALIVLAVPMAIVALLIRLKLGSPVIYKQERIGKNNEKFLLWKFRTMTEARDAQGIYLPDEDRLTAFGKMLRSTSIDELPSLINIIKGEMSIIGPRPLPIRYLPRYTPEQLRRHEIRPGLSNISVINGRNAQTWEDQFNMDVWYVDHVGFWIDIRSIFETFRIVFSRKGATSDDGDSRCEFIGTADVKSLNNDGLHYMKIRQM